MQEPLHKHAVERVVVHDHNPVAGQCIGRCFLDDSGWRRAYRGLLVIGRLVGREREPDRKGRPHAKRTHKRHSPPLLFNDLPDDGKA
mgnify:CR=1 FL=1